MNPIDVLNEWANLWSRFVWERLIESTLIFLILFGLWVLVRKRSSSQFGYWLFLLVLIKLLLPFDLSIPALQPYHPVYQTIQHMPEFPSRPLFFSPSSMDASIRSSGSKEIAGNPSESVARASSSNPAASNWGTLPSFNAWLMLAWIGITLGLLIRYVKMQSNVAGIVRNAQKVNQDAIPIDFDALKKTAGIKRFIPLLKSPMIRIPVVWGVFRPCIVIPTDFFTSFSTTQTYWILHHELAHIRRRDLLISFCQRIVHILYFFHPIVWICNRIINQEREYICDDTALVMSNSPREDCGDGFLSMIERIHHLPRYAETSLGLLNNKNHIRRRMMRILDADRKLHVGLTAASTALLISLACLLLPSVLAETESDESLSRSLHIAAANGDLDSVKRIIEKGADINAKDESGRTPLHAASNYGQIDIVKFLLEKNVDVNCVDKWGRTPLHLAVDFGSQFVPELLISKGANVNAKDNEGNTPLHIAAECYEGVQIELLQLLLSHDAEINARNDKGQTPLLLAASLWNTKKRKDSIIAFLIDKEADVNAKDENGKTPLYLAANVGWIEIVKMLLDKNANLYEQANDGSVALHAAAARGYKDVIELLIYRGIDVNVKQNQGWTPLHYAAIFTARNLTRNVQNGPESSVLEFLISKGADVNAEGIKGETPAQCALLQNCPDIANLLIAKGSEITTIQLASFVGDLSKVKSFVEKGISVSTEDGSGLTPLHAAASGGQKKVAEYLISEGASVNAGIIKEDLDSFYSVLGAPLHYAIGGNSKDVADLLIRQRSILIDAKNLYGQTPLHIAAIVGNIDLAKQLLERNADVNMRSDNNGNSPLHYAAQNGHNDLARLLINSGADLKLENRRGWTPFHNAVAWGHKDLAEFLFEKENDIIIAPPYLMAIVCNSGYKDIVEYLIKLGANINPAIDLHYEANQIPSLESVWNNHPDILQLLLDYGADPNAKDRYSWSLLHYTVYDGNVDMTRMLLDKGALVNVIENEFGRTPLSYAAEKGYISLVEMLIQQKADVNAKDFRGRTPLDNAKDHSQDEMIKLLRDHGAIE